MSRSRTLLRAGGPALVLVLAAGAAHAAGDGFSARNAAGTQINMRGHTLGTNDVLPVTGLADAAGNDFTQANPLRTAPGIAPATATDRGGAISGSAQAVLNGSTTRKGGWIQADPGNLGTVYVSYTGAASTSGGAGDQCALGAGATCPLTVNGYVIQSAVSVIGTHAGDKFEAVEFQ